jgi:hypothetical protein
MTSHPAAGDSIGMVALDRQHHHVSAKSEAPTVGRWERHSDQRRKRRSDVSHIYLAEVATRCYAGTGDEER